MGENYQLRRILSLISHIRRTPDLQACTRTETKADHVCDNVIVESPFSFTKNFAVLGSASESSDPEDHVRRSTLQSFGKTKGDCIGYDDKALRKLLALYNINNKVCVCVQVASAIIQC